MSAPIGDESTPATSPREIAATALVHSLGGILWEADGRTFAFTFVSPQAEALLGYPAERWVTEPDFWRAHIHPDDVDWCLAFGAEAVASGRDHTFEYRMIAADGRPVWVRDLITVERRDNGAVTLRGVTFDVSEWHRGDQHAERRARAMFDGAGIGMALVDLDARILESNRALQRMLGYTADELRSTAIPQITHPDDIARDAEMYTEVLRGGRDQYSLEKRLLRKDGTPVWIKLTATLVRDAAGRPEYGVGMAEDITDRKELETRLLHAHKMEAVGRLAGGIAHDFNNLLTVIRGYSDFIILGRADDDAVRHDAEEIRQAADRAALLIQQLLAFSRKQQLFPVVLDVNEALREVASMLERLLGEHITLVTRSGNVGTVTADRGQLQQVLVNLALNARDAMPLGGVLIIETRRARVERDRSGAPPGEYVAISVTDTGRGISADVLPRIFEPFFTTKDVGHGTGLGLATAYGIIEQSGGHLTVVSTPGRGSTFTILLPPSTERASEPEVTRRPVPRRKRSDGQTILLVDDQETVRCMTQHTLERCGYSVRPASGGYEALEIARQLGNEIDLVVTDIAMPGMSGPELVRELATLGGELPVIYLSGFADVSALNRARLGAGEHFLGKPFPPAQLEALVREVLDRAR